MIEDLDGVSVRVKEVQRPSAVAMAPRPIFDRNAMFVEVGRPTVYVTRPSHDQTQVV